MHSHISAQLACCFHCSFALFLLRTAMPFGKFLRSATCSSFQTYLAATSISPRNAMIIQYNQRDPTRTDNSIMAAIQGSWMFLGGIDAIRMWEKDSWIGVEWEDKRVYDNCQCLGLSSRERPWVLQCNFLHIYLIETHESNQLQPTLLRQTGINCNGKSYLQCRICSLRCIRSTRSHMPDICKQTIRNLQKSDFGSLLLQQCNILPCQIASKPAQHWCHSYKLHILTGRQTLLIHSRHVVYCILYEEDVLCSQAMLSSFIGPSTNNRASA